MFYGVNVRSFADSTGDGIGDLDDLVSKLDYLKGSASTLSGCCRSIRSGLGTPEHIAAAFDA